MGIKMNNKEIYTLLFCLFGVLWSIVITRLFNYPDEKEND